MDRLIVMVNGAREHAEAIQEEVAEVLASLGCASRRPRPTWCTWTRASTSSADSIQRRCLRGTGQRFRYTCLSKKALLSVTGKVRTLTRRARHRTSSGLLHRLNPVLRGWATYFQRGVSEATFSFLGHFAWQRGIGSLRKRHPGVPWALQLRRFLSGWTSTQDGSACSTP